ncbi:Satratoxin biosynthesis SC1 cluster protein 4 [Pseudocercospora fuligena]|uniref:Satratoxin biosynthesis SC1 cluster protein 4 n=1 Tax=Pseudocercospora fuligena TaxID=685502 RepID=A0A8H6VPI0_9PEZI|nr:Satratoxin biosynthesis SC1 cluster protein 4 [Pseudocercospora fuligena]
MVLYGYASPAAVTATVICLPILAVSLVGMRMYARFMVQKNAGVDDGFILVSVLFCIATSVMIIAQVENGLGKHVKQLEKHEAMRQQQDFLVMIVVYNICLCFTKLSILLQYTRIFPQKGFRLATWIVMGAVVIYAIWRVLAAIFTCLPVAAFWDKSIVNKHCQNKFNVAMASTALNMATDLTIALLPMPVLNQLQLPHRQRYALMAVFALGGLVVIISILRLPSLMTLWKSKDVSYVNPMVMIWSDIEINNIQEYE